MVGEKMSFNITIFEIVLGVYTKQKKEIVAKAEAFKLKGRKTYVTKQKRYKKYEN